MSIRWEKADASYQRRMSKYLDDTEDLLRPTLIGSRGPLSLRLDVALPRDRVLLDDSRLHDFAYPLVTRLTATVGRQFSSVWCTKRHAALSTITIEPAVPLAARQFGQTTTFVTRHSYAKLGFKEEVRDAVSRLAPIEEGPVNLHISFLTGFPRTWANLWKPTIDGLGRLLGTNPANPWEPHHNRVVELALHHESVGPSMRHKVQVTVSAWSGQPLADSG